jgi:hypothetical protein
MQLPRCVLAAVFSVVAACTGYVQDDGSTSEPARLGCDCTAGEVCDQGVCRSLAEGCSAGRLACGATCVDQLTNQNHCGACNNACADGRICSSGACVCLQGFSSCGNECANLQTDAQHCGSCDVACGGGRVCQTGACVCPPTLSLCGDQCADLQKDAAHCGACGTTCQGGQTCAAGQCVCPPGQELCGTPAACVDTLENDDHCGACGVECELGEACSAGLCAGGTLGEDGCEGLAQNLTLEQLAVYQGVKVPIMEGNAEVAVAERNTSVVAGREAVFRIFVTVGDGWSSRSLSARLFVENGEVVDSYYSKQTIGADSSDENPSSTFHVLLPKDKLTEQTRYAVEVVECGVGSGGVGSPRFPATDGIALGARNTGSLKVHLLPVQSNGRAPDTSTAGLAEYEDLIMAMYPITGVEFTVGESVAHGYPINWEALLDQVRSIREGDGAPDDVYYYGLLKPTDTFQEFCSEGCTAGLGYVPYDEDPDGADYRAAIGIGWSDASSAETMAHEIGHNHGREHSPCGGPDSPDPNYPYDNAAIGVWGYDSRSDSLLAPFEHSDIMSYCSDQWISDYTYDAILERVANVNANRFVIRPPGAYRDFRILLVGASGASWGIPTKRPVLPHGAPELADILDAAGNVLTQVEVYRTVISDVGASSIQIPLPEPGWHAVRVQGASPVAF